MRVLIVEDDVVVALAFRLAMESLGLEVCGTAATEQTAMVALARASPDMLTVDVRLGAGGDGLRVAEEAWHTYGLRSLLITGDPAAVAPDRAARIQVLGCLVKPVGFTLLRNRLDEIRNGLTAGPYRPVPVAPGASLAAV